MSSLRKLFAIAFLFLPAGYSDTVTVLFTALPSTLENGTYNGFSTATVNGIPLQMLMCDDYNDTTYMPSSSNLIYDSSKLTGANPLQYAMFDSSTPSANLQKYDEAGVLTYELAQLGSGASADTVTDYQYALWNLMIPSAPLDPSHTSQEQTLQANALALVDNASQQAFLNAAIYPYINVYTPTAADKGNQEFLQYAAPEPNLAWFAGLVLASALIFGRKFRFR